MSIFIKIALKFLRHCHSIRAGDALDVGFQAALGSPCPACLTSEPDGPHGFCRFCFDSLEILRDPLCPGCGGAMDGILDLCPECLKLEPWPWMRAWSCLRMEGRARRLVHRLKYRGEAVLARPLGSLLASRWKETGLPVDMVVPVPMHWSRVFRRGYNQSELLSLELRRWTGIPVHSALRRVRMTPPQSGLGLLERQSNLNGAFQVNASPGVRKSVV